MKKYDLVIVGSGLFGATVAFRANEEGMRCLVLERRNVCGGNVYDESADGFHVSKYGAHIFHTDNECVWNFIGRFADFNDYTHRVLIESNGKKYHIPVCAVTFNEIFGTATVSEMDAMLRKEHSIESYANPKNLEEMAINRVGRRVYELLIKGYTEKQWGRQASELPKEIIERLPVRMNYDTRYFSDRFQGMPSCGYTELVKRMLKGVEVLYGVDFNASKEYWVNQTETIVYTGMIDELMDYRYGALECRSLRFETSVLETTLYQQCSVLNNGDKDVPFTRTIEHKHFYECKRLPYTVITKEFSAEWEKGREAFYPINDDKNQKLYKRYLDEANVIYPNIILGGRLGCYEYNDMDDTVEKALKLSNVICRYKTKNPLLGAEDARQ